MENKMRHIPKSCSQNIELILFEDAKKASETETTDYDKNKWIYIPPTYQEYRYLLGTKGDHPLICIGINPSTARPNALDRTLQSVQRISMANGFDSFLMFNAYPQRATLPDDMDLVCNQALHRENMAAFSYALSRERGHAPCIWAAWGQIITKRPWLADCLDEMIEIGETYGAKWVTSGPRSKAGHPHHPLYLRSDSALDPFDPRQYVDEVLPTLRKSGDSYFQKIQKS